MYIHIGGEACVPDKYVIGIFDMDAVTIEGSSSRDFLARMEESGKVEPVLPEIPRSIVLTDERVYLTPLSVQTLTRRFENGASEDTVQSDK